MDEGARDSMWLGRIRSSATAIRTTNWAGGVMMVVGLGPLASTLEHGESLRDHVGSFIVAVMFAAPGAFVFFKRNRAGAVTAFAVCALVLAASAVLATELMLREHAVDAWLVLIPVGIIAALTWLAWRAIVAAWFLTRPPAPDHHVAAATFD